VNFRSAFRYPTMSKVTILLRDGVNINRAVRHISTEGACLELVNVEKLSEQFFLLIHGQSERFRCYRAWQKGSMVGVQYI
jgi:hypothetical protein